MAKSKYIETLEEQYTKKDGKSVLRYKAPDNKWRYIQTGKDASGGNPMPSGGGMVEVKWQELKGKRDNGELNPGSLYRITDYNCTTTQENTRSASHQFDIVLLALSEDKLAEEGWAMMHDGVDMFDDYDIYTITFTDGVSKQYFFKEIPNSGGSVNTEYRIVDTETFLGNSLWHNPALDGFVINTENKTATNKYLSSTEFESYLQTQYSYNYFQNSNLSAWKVWYCLDNDKSRFAWADDSVDGDIPATITSGNVVYVRDTTKDDETKEFPYGWISDSFTWRYTRTTTPNVGDVVSDSHVDPGRNPPKVQSYTPVHEGTNLPNGRGVIYRLIDEWNNDVPYDFKNIVIFLGGKIEEGYLFSHTEGNLGDISLTGIFNDITVKKTIDDNNCQVIDMGILVTDATECCNIIVASGALSEEGANNLSSNFIFGYTME